MDCYGGRQLGIGGCSGSSSGVVPMMKWTDLPLQQEQERPAFLPPKEVNFAPQTPLCSKEVGEVDTSHARFLVIDRDSLKELGDLYDRTYSTLLHFAYKCYLKCELRKFTHPGNENNMLPGGLASFEGEEINTQEFFLRRASIAITQYNSICEANLKLEKLLKVNILLADGENFYMTFTAYDEDTGETGTYKAALKGLYSLQKVPAVGIDIYVLGLFIDCSTDKVLACIYVKGGEEDLAAIKAKQKYREEVIKNNLEKEGWGASREILKSN